MQIRHVIDGPIATVVLSDPPTKNALHDAALVELRAVLDDIAANGAVTTVVLRGDGDAFSSGGALGSVGELAELALTNPDATTERVRKNSSIVERILEQPQLTVALITGAAVGAGLGLAAACDIRYATPNAKLIPAFGAIGITTDVGTSSMLNRAIGTSRANAWLLTGEPWNAAAGVAAGFVAEMAAEDDLKSRIRSVADSLGAGSGERTLRQRQLLLDRQSLSSELDREAATFTESLRTAAAQDLIRGLAKPK